MIGGRKMRHICVCTQSRDGQCGKIQFRRTWCAEQSGCISCISHIIFTTIPCFLKLFCFPIIESGNMFSASTSENQEFSKLPPFPGNHFILPPGLVQRLPEFPLSHAPANDAPPVDQHLAPLPWYRATCYPRMECCHLLTAHHYCRVMNMPGGGVGLNISPWSAA